MKFHPTTLILRLTFFSLGLIPFTPLRADVRLAAIFSDHAVLQRDKPLPVWGSAAPGESVEIELGREKATTLADENGRWRVTLAPQPVSTTPLNLTVSGADRISRQDILLGDVWLCSGQSNMDLTLGACQVPEDIAAAYHPLIRHFRVGYNFAIAPTDDVVGSWAVCTPGTAPGFSAVGYYFGRKVQAETGVPIGLLSSSVGGTNIELWISPPTLLTTPGLEDYADQMRKSLAIYQDQLASILPAARDWAATGADAVKAGRPIPLPPVWPEHPFSDKVMRPRCVTLHNGMIAPLVPLSLRGAIWYQGENNADDSLYLIKQKALFGEWRKLFQNPSLPVYFVQLAAWKAPDELPAGSGWGMIRDLQRQGMAMPHTGMACTIDIGDANDIHPRNKFDVGERLSRWALHHEYGRKEIITSGPLFRGMSIEDGKVRIHFDSIGGGLVIARKSGRAAAVPTPGDKLRRFAIAGEDRKWAWADAVIDGDTVVVSSPGVASPVAVRYAYSDNPQGANLYNQAGLPASPFRSDSW